MNAHCVNTHGSYECICSEGYGLSGAGSGTAELVCTSKECVCVLVCDCMHTLPACVFTVRVRKAGRVVIVETVPSEERGREGSRERGRDGEGERERGGEGRERGKGERERGRGGGGDLLL